MKIRYRLLTFALIVGFLGIGTAPSFAQVGDIGNILQSGKEDANALAKAYLKPFGSGFGASLNTGWTNAASTHKKFGFDITVSAGLAVVPTAAKSFDVTQLGLQTLELEGGSGISPTINGTNETGSLLAAYADPDGAGGISPQKILEFNMPQGTNFGYVPAPMIKAGVGLIKDTDVMLRYTPEYDLGDFGSFKIFGIGAKHGINQWLPGGKALPVNLSVMFGYTNMEVGADLDLTASDAIQRPSETYNPYDVTEWSGQSVTLDTDAWTVNALVGKKFPVISLYAGVGYESSTFNISTPGSYPTVVPNPNFDPTNSNDQTRAFMVDAVEKPLDVAIDGENGFRALAGFRFRVAFFHISGSYTLANYSSYNVGLGISFR